MRGGADDAAQTSYGRVLAAVLDLEQERPADARARLASAPEAGFLDRAFAPWRAALLAEAAVLSGAVDADLYVERAVRATAEFGVPDVLARRAAMLLDGRSPAGLAAELATAGCPYQAERTRILAARASR
jgi:hypothetical protein